MTVSKPFLFLAALLSMLAAPTVNAKKCKNYQFDDVDVMVAFTENARNYLAKDFCGDLEQDDTFNTYFKRYMIQRVDETNKALKKACVPYQIRVVKTVGPWRTLNFDETLNPNGSVHDRFAGSGPIKSEDMDKYGADAKILFYHHSIDMKGGIQRDATITVPLQIETPCEPGIIRESKDLYLLPNLIGFFLGARSFRGLSCAEYHPGHSTIMGNLSYSGCKPRHLIYSNACAEKMTSSDDSDYMIHRKPRAVGDCETMVNNMGSGDGKLGDDACTHALFVHNMKTPPEPIVIEPNSAMCDYDKGDCCKPNHERTWNSCVDPAHVKADICTPRVNV